MNRKLLAVLSGILSLSTLTAYAEDTCTVISAAEVAQAFHIDNPKLLAAEASGMCTWMLKDSDLLNIQTHKRPTPNDTREMFESFEQTTVSRLTRTLSKPKIGQRALVAMSPAESPQAEAAILALDQETLVSISYFPQSQGKAMQPDDVRSALENVGALVLSHKAAADQTFGKCDLLTAQDIDRLLGKGKKTIHRLGSAQCIASVQPGSSSLVAMSTNRVNESSLQAMFDMAANGCTRVSLPEFGQFAHATYACGAPGDAALAIHMVKNGIYTTVILSPTDHKATAADLEALRPVAQRIYQRQ